MRSKLKIENYSKWDIRDLRRLFLRCMMEEDVKNCYVEVFDISIIIKDRLDIRGFADIINNKIWMFIPDSTYSQKTQKIYKMKNKMTLWITYYIAQVFTHELHHLKGLTHKDMIPVDEIDVRWVTKRK